MKIFTDTENMTVFFNITMELPKSQQSVSQFRHKASIHLGQ